MNASESVRAKKLCMTQYLSRSQCADAGLRTWNLQQATNSYYTNPNPPESVSVQQCAVAMNPIDSKLMVTYPPEAHIGFGGNMITPIMPIPGASCSACTSENTFYLPPLAIPGTPVVYLSNNYVSPCKVLPFQGTAKTVGAISSCCGVFNFGPLNQ
jgi:hypothetical protein